MKFHKAVLRPFVIGRRMRIFVAGFGVFVASLGSHAFADPYGATPKYSHKTGEFEGYNQPDDRPNWDNSQTDPGNGYNQPDDQQSSPQDYPVNDGDNAGGFDAGNQVSGC